MNRIAGEYSLDRWALARKIRDAHFDSDIAVPQESWNKWLKKADEYIAKHSPEIISAQAKHRLVTPVEGRHPPTSLV